MESDRFGLFVDDMPTIVCFYRDALGIEIREEENSRNVYLFCCNSNLLFTISLLK